jgi:hypothetical protein
MKGYIKINSSLIEKLFIFHKKEKEKTLLG